ncbi:glutathione S-transferase family protein [Hoeflea sp. BAL378]|uniref:glutathione S-transferase family protein n=1 Tax=Hoeflea sp. BAL378 TaxID=1547437 RepID=UPI00068F0909|nr:glutathione S-transferase family protein [Hoeflea sp. BAL378]
MTARDPVHVTLIGADYSVYSRICRLALRLKRVPHHFEPLDVFAPDGPGRARAAGHPFGKIPLLRHGPLTLHETLAITRYIDQAFDGPPLEPADPALRARMNQIVSIVDTGVYPIIVWGLHVPKSKGLEPDPGMIAKARTVLGALEALALGPWLCGEAQSLADAYLAACMDYVADSAVGEALPDLCPRLARWRLQAGTLPPFA